MKTIKRATRLLAAMATAGLLSQAQAALVSVSPSTLQNIAAIGGTATFDIVVSGLSGVLGGYGLTLSFDSGLLGGVSYDLLAVGDKMGVAPFDLSCGFATGVAVVGCPNGMFGTKSPFDLQVAADGTDQATLATRQGTGFTLATLTVSGLTNGLSALTLSNVVLSDFNGISYTGTTMRNGSVCVGGDCRSTVPAPATTLLVAAALGALALSRKAKQA